MSGDACPERVRLALNLAQAEYELAGLRRRLRFERWTSIIAVCCLAVLFVVSPCPGS